MAYKIIVRRVGENIPWRSIMDDLVHYPRARPNENQTQIVMHDGTVFDVSHARSLSGESAPELFLHVQVSESADHGGVDVLSDIGRFLRKKYGVQLWHEAYNLDYATATENELTEAFDGAGLDEGGG